MDHEPYCPGVHLPALSCAGARAWREHASPWHCHHNRTGHHGFTTGDAHQRCLYDGCQRTWGELHL